MRISIDTKEDSHEEIKKVIKMLQHIIGEPSESSLKPSESASSSSEPDDQASSAFNDIFSNMGSSSSEQPEKDVEQQDEGINPIAASEKEEDPFSDLFSPEDLNEKKERPNVEFYN